MDIIEQLKRTYRAGSMLTRLIYINAAVWVVLRLLVLVPMMLGVDSTPWLQWVEVPSAPATLLRRPWTVLTYMVAHYDVLHILFNMLWLYWLGRIFMEYFNGKQLAGLYVLGGLGGALFYLAGYNLLPAFADHQSYMLGASAAVIAIVTGIAVVKPDYKIRLLFLGDISLKWVAIVTVGIDLLSLTDVNAGGHLAHVGGALTGLAFGLCMRRGHDITRPVNAVLDALSNLWQSLRRGSARLKGRTRRQSQPGTADSRRRAEEKFRKATAQQQRNQGGVTEEELDAVLDKIKRSGYGSLTEHERDVLFRASRRREP